MQKMQYLKLWEWSKRRCYRVPLDSKTIETLAVNAVKDSIITTDFLEQYIAENDKEPSWDGFVYIYGNKKKTKDTLEGRMAD